MPALGDLERAVMERLWSTPDAVTAYELRDELLEHGSRELAATTVLTVLSRLEAKGFVRRERAARPHRYSAVATRESHMAELMHDVLGGADDRIAVLERFLGGVSPEDAAALRALLDGR